MLILAKKRKQPTPSGILVAGELYQLVLLRVKTRDFDGNPLTAEIISDMEKPLTLDSRSEMNQFITGYVSKSGLNTKPPHSS